MSHTLSAVGWSDPSFTDDHWAPAPYVNTRTHVTTGTGTETDPFVSDDYGYDHIGTYNMYFCCEWSTPEPWNQTGELFFVHIDRLYKLVWADGSKSRCKIVHVRPWTNYDEEGFHTTDLHDLLEKYLPDND